MNMSMYNVNPTQSNMHISIINQTPTNLNQMHASSRVPFNSMYQKHYKRGEEEKVIKNRRCVIHLKSEQKLKTTKDPYVHGPDKPSEEIKSEFLLEHDSNYLTSACFHLNFQWIFARGPEIQERVIKRLQRDVKQLSNGRFKIMQISELIRQLQLNPFETETILREDYNKRAQNELVLRNQKSTEQLERERKSVIGEDFNMVFLGQEDE